MRVRHHTGLVGVLVATVLAVSGCSSGEGGDDGGSGTPVVVRITQQDGEIEPSGKTVEVETGQDVTLVVSSDAPDELHVHSEPEREFDVKAADGQRFTFSIDTPGTYEVESHELEVVIVKLQVS